MNDMVGQTLGNYRLVEHLGRGGMADVYKALHIELNVHRAIKVIRQEYVTSDDFRTRFHREAQAVARLEHPNIVRVHDFGIHDGQYFMVMQLIQGQDLATVLRLEGRLPTARAVELVVKIAGALEFAHRLDLIHRDIKPDNIMLDANGQPILMDFGIAKLLTASTSLTQTGLGIGTPAYMAPEQAQGFAVSATADLYALCVVLFELVTGEQPYRAETPIATMMKVINDPLPLPRSIAPELSEAVEAVIIKGTAKNGSDRHQDALELITDLNNAVGISATTIVVARTARRKKQLNSQFFSLSMIEIATISVGLIGGMVMLGVWWLL